VCALACFFIVLMVVIALAADSALVYALVTDRASRRWWVVLLVVALGGPVLGWWCGFRCQYNLGDGRVVYGVPLSSAIETTRDGEVVGGQEPPFPGLVMLLDALVVALLAPVPLSVTYFAWREISEAIARRRERFLRVPD